MNKIIIILSLIVINFNYGRCPQIHPVQYRVKWLNYQRLPIEDREKYIDYKSLPSYELTAYKFKRDNNPYITFNTYSSMRKYISEIKKKYENINRSLEVGKLDRRCYSLIWVKK